MLENPEIGDAKKISTIGLLQWRIDGALDVNASFKGFSVEQRYIPVERDIEGFVKFIEKFIGIIEGDYPTASPECRDCEFLSEIGFYSK